MNQKSSNGVVRKRRVFIVDDHPLVRDGLANFINQQADLVVSGEAEDSAGAIAGIFLPGASVLGPIANFAIDQVYKTTRGNSQLSGD